MQPIKLGDPISLCVAIPMYGASCYGDCAMSLVNLGVSCSASRIKFEIICRYNDSIISWARNELVRQFLQTSHTHLLFVDADVAFDARDVFLMAAANKDVIGGIYPKKSIDWNRVHRAALSGVPPDELLQYAVDYPVRCDRFGYSEEPIEVEGVGTGLMLIKRGVFESMAREVPSYTDEDGNRGVAEFFSMNIAPDGLMWSEDMSFCKKWREMGGKVFAAPWTKTSHWGTYKYSGRTVK